MNDTLLTARQAADLIGVSARTLWDWTSPRGDIPCIRPGKGRTVRYSRLALDRWIADQIAESAAEATPIETVGCAA